RLRHRRPDPGRPPGASRARRHGLPAVQPREAAPGPGQRPRRPCPAPPGLAQLGGTRVAVRRGPARHRAPVPRPRRAARVHLAARRHAVRRPAAARRDRQRAGPGAPPDPGGRAHRQPRRRQRRRRHGHAAARRHGDRAHRRLDAPPGRGGRDVRRPRAGLLSGTARVRWVTRRARPRGAPRDLRRRARSARGGHAPGNAPAPPAPVAPLVLSPLRAVLRGPAPTAPPHVTRSGRNLAGVLLLAVALALAARVVELRPLELARDAGNIATFLRGYLRPSFVHIGEYAWQCVVTLCIALWGTVLAVTIAVPLGLLGARNL